MDRITRAEVFAIGPPNERISWCADLAPLFMTQNLLRIETEDGFEGVAATPSFSESGFDTSVTEALRPLLGAFDGADPLAREAIWQRLAPTAPVRAHSLIDVALWDYAAKRAGLPLYRYMGAHRDRIPAYASTPFYAETAPYFALIDALAARGFRHVKLHSWCEPARDMALVDAIASRYAGTGLSFMLDVEQRYGYDDALTVGRALAERGFTWFEAPLPDTDLDGYARLRRELDIPILAAGQGGFDLQGHMRGLRAECWSMVRGGTSTMGGITPLRKLAALGEAAGLPAELQCWGYTLTQAANLQVMLAHPNCGYFEQAVPFEAFEFGTIDVIRADDTGHVAAPAGDGLGVAVDWDAVHDATIDRYEVTF